MKHQYRTEVFWKKSLQRIVDFIVDLYARFFIDRNIHKQFTEPKKILFVSLGHLGDALIGSYIFPLINERYPNSQIDVLTSEWCKPVLENNPYVRNLIYFNHFRMNRSEISLWEKIRIHLISSSSALKIIRQHKYDISIEGRISHPNGNLLCYRGRIERRIGFGSGGFGSLLTDEILFPQNSNFHMIDALLEELKIIGIQQTLESIKPYFIVLNQSIHNQQILSDYMKEPFIIMHVETGKGYLPQRLINDDFWLKIVQIILSNTNLKIIVCGISPKSIAFVDFLISNLSEAKERVINAVIKLSLDEFYLLSRNAIAAITVDSFAAHFCAINCNTISFFKNGFGALFFPISDKKAKIIHNHLPSKDLKRKPATLNYYVENIESEESYSIFIGLVKKMLSDQIS
jgi:heptosyltransferase-3